MQKLLGLVYRPFFNKTKYWVIFGVLFVGGVYLWSNSVSKPPVDDTVVATISDRTITVDEFKKKMLQRSGGRAQYFSSIENKRVLLNEIIQRELQIINARHFGYQNDPDIKAALDKLILIKLRTEQLTPLLSEIAIDDEEITDYYQSNIKKYTTPAMSRVAIIRLALSNQADAENQSKVKIKAQEVLKLARTLPESVRGFGSLAAQYSDDQATRYIGGDIGWLKAGQSSKLNASVRKSVSALKNNGELSTAIKAEGGYYLAKLIRKKPEQLQKIATVSQSIRRILLHEKHRQVEAEWLSSLDGFGIKTSINEAVLESVIPPDNTRMTEQQDTPPALPKG